MDNLQFICKIIEDICGIVKGYSRDCQKVSTESSKGVFVFVEGHQHSQNCQRHPQNCVK